VSCARGGISWTRPRPVADGQLLTPSAYVCQASTRTARCSPWCAHGEGRAWRLCLRVMNALRARTGSTPQSVSRAWQTRRWQLGRCEMASQPRMKSPGPHTLATSLLLFISHNTHSRASSNQKCSCSHTSCVTWGTSVALKRSCSGHWQRASSGLPPPPPPPPPPPAPQL